MNLLRRLGRLLRFTSLTVQGWFGVVFAVLAVLVIIAVVIILGLLNQTRTVTSDLENGILPAQAQSYRLQAALLDQETGVRGYGITGQANFLQPYTAGLATERSAEAQLRTEIGHNHQLESDLSRLERAANSWRRSYAVPLIALAGHGPLGGKDLTLLNASKTSFDHLRALFAVQNTHLAAAAAADRASEGRVRDDNNLAFAIILAVFLLAAMALTVVLHRAVVQPLNRLREGSRRVVGGDYGHRIEPSGPTDLHAVANDVDEMRSELVTALQGAKSAEEVAARQAGDLARQAGDLARQAGDLDAQAAELRRSNAELEQFAYVASHDLQEPLRKVASFCQLLEKRYGDQLDERGLQYIDFAVDGAKRMQVLINDLLTFSRVGRAGDVSVRLRLDRPLDAAVAAVAVAAEESGAVIERPFQLPEVMGDMTLLTMLWQNLLGNGIKFRSPDRSPVMRVTVSGPQAGLWRFCVQDNGIGIAPEFSDKIFVIFQRLHGRDDYPGTGIGLALCKRIVEYYGGTISLDEQYGEGTRICFTLPQIDGAPDEGAPGKTSTEGIPA
ncbi:MAG TPA: CHASE3 domain-containing protein [Streptosporangiaceae bacterium]